MTRRGTVPRPRGQPLTAERNWRPLRRTSAGRRRRRPGRAGRAGPRRRGSVPGPGAALVFAGAGCPAFPADPQAGRVRVGGEQQVPEGEHARLGGGITAALRIGCGIGADAGTEVRCGGWHGRLSGLAPVVVEHRAARYADRPTGCVAVYRWRSMRLAQPSSGCRRSHPEPLTTDDLVRSGKRGQGVAGGVRGGSRSSRCRVSTVPAARSVLGGTRGRNRARVRGADGRWGARCPPPGRGGHLCNDAFTSPARWSGRLRPVIRRRERDVATSGRGRPSRSSRCR